MQETVQVGDVVTYWLDRGHSFQATVTKVYEDFRVDLVSNENMMIHGQRHGTERLGVRPGYGSREAGVWEETPAQPLAEPDRMVVTVSDQVVTPITTSRDENDRISLSIPNPVDLQPAVETKEPSADTSV